MSGFPFLFFGLTGAFVATLLLRKARRVPSLGRVLSIASAVCAGLVGVISLFVFLFQAFDIPGPGIILAPATLLSIAFWTASLIWAGPATSQDRYIFVGTVVLISLIFVSAVVLG